MGISECSLPILLNAVLLRRQCYTGNYTTHKTDTKSSGIVVAYFPYPH